MLAPAEDLRAFRASTISLAVEGVPQFAEWGTTAAMSEPQLDSECPFDGAEVGQAALYGPRLP